MTPRLNVIIKPDTFKSSPFGTRIAFHPIFKYIEGFMILIKLILGFVLLAFGRKLVWLSIALVGFIAGFSAAQSFIPDRAIWYVIGVGIIVGLLFVLLARFVKNIAFGLGGFLLGAYLVNSILEVMKLELGTLSWIFILMGGALGAFFLLAAFELGLKVLSSFAGAMLIVQTLPSTFAFKQIAFLALIILGVVIQSRTNRNKSNVV